MGGTKESSNTQIQLRKPEETEISNSILVYRPMAPKNAPRSAKFSRGLVGRLYRDASLFKATRLMGMEQKIQEEAIKRQKIKMKIQDEAAKKQQKTLQRRIKRLERQQARAAKKKGLTTDDTDIFLTSVAPVEEETKPATSASTAADKSQDAEEESATVNKASTDEASNAAAKTEDSAPVDTKEDGVAPADTKEQVDAAGDEEEEEDDYDDDDYDDEFED